MEGVKKVIISDYSDGFCVDLFFTDGRESLSYNFNQEDNRSEMKKLFKALGIKEVRYQEVY